MSRRSAVLFTVLTATVSAATTSAADEARVRLRFERSAAAAACADERSMRDAVAARLGYDPFVADSNTVVSIALDRRAGQWTARIALDDVRSGHKGARSLASSESTCDELFSAVSLGVALAIDPLRLREPPTPAPPPERLPDVSAAPPPTTPSPSDEVAKPPRASATPFASAGGFVAAGVVPGVSFGPRLRFGWRWSGAAAAFEGLLVARSSTGSASGRVEATVVAGGVSPCLTLRPSMVVVDACARGVAGALFGEASGVGRSSPSTSPYVAAGAELAVEIPIASNVGLRIHGGALATIARTYLRIRDADREVDVWRSPVLSGSAGLDALMHFP